MTTNQNNTFADNIYAVILAGGSGTRFWPKSRLLRPKQLCKIGDLDSTMIEETLKRLDGRIPPERRIIVTHHAQAEATRKIVGDICPTIISEPEARNTAAALALAAVEIESRGGEGSKPIMISLHADALIEKEENFISTLHKAVQVAQDGYLTLVGVTPSYAETGYGYIEVGDSLSTDGAFTVKSFREKPHKELAEEYLASGNFSWNSGIFVWQTSTMLEELHKNVPVIVDSLRAVSRQSGKTISQISHTDLKETYSKLPKIAIDNAILETSSKVGVVAGDLGWQDVGSWDSLIQCFEPNQGSNLVYGEALTLDCDGVTIDSDGPLVAAIGMKDTVVVKSGNAILVCPSSRAQDVKKIVEQLKDAGRDDYT